MSDLNLNPFLTNSLKKYSYFFKEVNSFLVDFIIKIDVSNNLKSKTYWTVLYWALNQQIDRQVLEHFLIKIYQKFGDDIFELPVVSEDELELIIAETKELQYWQLHSKITGIIWSVGRFTRKYDFEKLFIHTKNDIVAKIIGEEIFYMGQGRISNKVLGLMFSLYSFYPFGIGITGAKTELKSFASTGNLWLWLLKNNVIEKDVFDEMTISSKISFASNFYKSFSYDEASLIKHSLDFYRESNLVKKNNWKNNDFNKDLRYVCQEIVSCAKCPFNENCNSRN